MSDAPTPPTVRKSLAWRFRRALFLLALFAIAGTAGAFLVVSQVPLPPETPELTETTFVCGANVSEDCSADNALVGLSAGEYRSLVEFEDIPLVLRSAVIAAEDKDFFTHGGVDPVGIARAALEDIRTRSTKQGGSTITQQYVKNAYLTADRTAVRKIREAVIAVKLERELGKEEILKRYLNTIYFGRGAYGVQAASQAYFGRDISKLDLSEAAYLAALIRSPETTDASRAPDVAQRRRRSVLDAMVKQDMITEAEAEAADQPWDQSHLVPREEANDLGRVFSTANGSEYFIDAVRQYLVERYGWTEVSGGGLRVYTSFDPDMQREAYRAVGEVLSDPDDPDAAMVVLDDRGHVRAMVGGRDFSQSQVNLALGTEGGGSGRQPGSAFKPIVLADALDNNISLRSVFDSTGTEVFPEANDGKDWKVSNYGNADHGVIDLLEATRVSSNIAYADLAIALTPDEIRRTASRMGISAELPQVNSLALGTAEVSVMDMATAYSTLANRGELVEPIMVVRVEKKVDGEWQTVDDFEDGRRTRVLNTDVADTVDYVLSQVVASGTGTAAQIDQPAAGKTGTTQDNRDAWFVGFTCKLTAATWVGYGGGDGDTGRTMDNVRGQAVTGGSFPAQIWKRFMDEATVGLDSCPFEEPKSLPGRILNRELLLRPDAAGLPLCDATADKGTMVDSEGNEVPCQLRLCGQNTTVDGSAMKLNNGNEVPCRVRLCNRTASSGQMVLPTGERVPCRSSGGSTAGEAGDNGAGDDGAGDQSDGGENRNTGAPGVDSTTDTGGEGNSNPGSGQPPSESGGDGSANPGGGAQTGGTPAPAVPATTDPPVPATLNPAPPQTVPSVTVPARRPGTGPATPQGGGQSGPA